MSLTREPRRRTGSPQEGDMSRRSRERLLAVVAGIGLTQPSDAPFSAAANYAHRLLSSGEHRGGATRVEHSGISGVSHAAIIRDLVTIKTHQRFTGVTFRSDSDARLEQIRVFKDPNDVLDSPVLLLDHCVFVRPDGSWKTHIVVDADCYAVLINPTFVGGSLDDPDGTTACVIQNNAAVPNVVVLGGHNDTGNCLGNVTTFGMPLGGPSTSITTITVSTTLTGAYQVVLVDASSASVTVTLPAAASYREKVFSIKKIDSSANIVTVAAASGELIDGAATHIIPIQYVSVDVVSDGTQWWLV